MVNRLMLQFPPRGFYLPHKKANFIFFFFNFKHPIAAHKKAMYTKAVARDVHMSSFLKEPAQTPNGMMEYTMPIYIYVIGRELLSGTNS